MFPQIVFTEVGKKDKSGINTFKKLFQLHLFAKCVSVCAHMHTRTQK